MNRLQGKVALVTGGAGGIGAATVRAFVHQQCQVLFTDLDVGRGQALAAELGASVRFVRSDHCRAEDNRAAVQATVETFGSLHILFNNAGIALQGPLAGLDPAVVERVIATNLLGPILMTQAALPALRATPDAGRSILFNGSVQSLIVRPTFAIYGATKHAVAGLVGSLALELAPEGIRVNGLCPGPVDTTVFRESIRNLYEDTPDAVKRHIAGVPLGRFVLDREIADAAVFLASNEASAITGVMLPVDGGITAR